MGMMTTGAGAVTGISAAQAAANTWNTAVIAAGASPLAGTKSALATFYQSIFDMGRALSDFDYGYLLIGENPADSVTNRYNQKKINIFGPGTFDATVVNPNASGHTANGTLGDGSMYFTNTFGGATAPVVRTTNASLGVIVTVVGALADRTLHGIFLNHYCRGSYSGNRMSGYGTGGDAVVAGAVSPPQILYTESNATAVRIVQGSSAIGIDLHAPTALPNDKTASVFCLTNESATPFQQSGSTLAFAWHGKGITSTNYVAWESDLRTLMSAFSVTLP